MNKTPRSENLDAVRRATGERRSPAYRGALALCRQLETELFELRAKQPKEGRFYMLGGQIGDVVPGHVLIETKPVAWCHFEQSWTTL